MLSCVRLFATLSTLARQAPLSMGFFRQENWSGLPFPSPGDLPHPGMKLCIAGSPVLQADSLPTELQGGNLHVIANEHVKPDISKGSETSPKSCPGRGHISGPSWLSCLKQLIKS